MWLLIVAAACAGLFPGAAVYVNAVEHRPAIPNEGYMRLPAVLSVFPVSKSTWWAGISAGRFPKGVKLGPRITAWKVKDIRKLIESVEAA
jgi:prophage regulatory protein